MSRSKEIFHPPDPDTKLNPELVLLLRCFKESEAQPLEYRAFLRKLIDPYLTEMFQVMAHILHECQVQIDNEWKLCQNGEANLLDDHDRTIVSIIISQVDQACSYITLDNWYTIYLEYHLSRPNGDLKPVIRKIKTAFESKHVKVKQIKAS